jgi:cell division protease FtsH
MVEEEDDDGLFDEDEMGDDDWILPDDLLSLPIKQRIFGLQKKSALDAKKALLHNLSQTLNKMERKGSPGSKESDGSEERGGDSTEEQDLDPSEWRKKVLQRGYKTSPGQKKRKIMAKKSSTGAFIIDPKLARYNFTHIGGYEEVKEELIQVTDFMRNPEKYKPYKVRLPRGILLYGAPGTGKTLFAKCVAGECNIAFIATSGSEFQEKYVGMGASRVRELFEFARQNTPCIIFIDEMDGIGRKRGSDGEAAQAERDQTLNQLLVEMDGYNGNEQIMVMGSTNRIDILDPALLRPGRLDKHIQVSLPDFNTRCAIIKIHLDNKPVNVTVEAIAKSTAGWSGAQIENLLNEVSLYGIRKNVLPVNSSVLETYTDYAILGKVMTPLNFSVSTLWRIAVHEMGHTLVAMNTQHHEKPSKCSIISPNGQMAGYTTFDRNTQHKNEDDGVLMTREYLGDRMSILLGGRIAEEIIYGTSVSTGASDDLQKCLDLAKKMVMDLGMGKRIVYPRSSEKSLQEIDNDISDKIEEAYGVAFEYLKNNSDLLRFMSQQLLLAKTLDNQQMVSMIETFLKYKQIR